MSCFMREESRNSVVTPYLHWLFHHSEQSLDQVGSLGLFSCEALERHNSFLRRWVKNHCNYVRPTECAMLFEYSSLRLEFLAPLCGPRGKKRVIDDVVVDDDVDVVVDVVVDDDVDIPAVADLADAVAVNPVDEAFLLDVYSDVECDDLFI